MLAIDTVSHMILELIDMNDLIQLFAIPFFQRALIASILIAVVASTSGTFLVFRGLSFMTAGVAHAALGGAALGMFLQYSGILPWFDPVLGSLIFSVLVAVVTGYAGESGISQKMEVAVGVSFALSMSIAVFLLHYIPPTQVPQVWGYLVGDILLLDNLDVVLLGGTAIILVLIALLFNKEYVYVSVDMEGSIAHGLNARAYHYLMLITSALAIAFATKAVGAILVYAIMVAPAAASNEVMRSVRGVMVTVFFFALVSEVVGLFASLTIQASPSAIAGIIAALIYVVTMQIKRFRDRVNADFDTEFPEEEDLSDTFYEALSASAEQAHEHEHNHD
ncbi:MAG: iron chelate uptake ABC transporter family permease subunit [Candidatus Lokiarchaeota archaeon]|nr:iron chelate uptake ABC transporter family permease subunit [Candidatus Lokiarchaeota archaeon]